MIQAPEALPAVRRSGQVYYAQLGEQTALSCGVALTCPRYPNFYDGNHLREVVLAPTTNLDLAFAEVNEFFAQQSLRCYRWVPAGGQSTAQLEPFLVSHGFEPIHNLAMQHVHDVAIPIKPGIRILPARAMRKAFNEVIQSKTAYAPKTREMLAAVEFDRLDNPQFDMFVAMLGDQPAGHGALIQVGEIGGIENVFVVDRCRHQGVGQALVSHLVALARRLALRVICLETELSNVPAQTLYTRCGFERGDTFVEYIAPEALRDGLFHLSIDQ